MKGNTKNRFMLLVGACLLMQVLPVQAAYEANVRNACPQRWETILDGGIPKIKIGSGTKYKHFAIDKIGATTNVWSMSHYFSGKKLLETQSPQIGVTSTVTAAIIPFYGDDNPFVHVPVTSRHLIQLAKHDNRVRRGLFLTAAEQTKWNQALAARKLDMEALFRHIKAARVTQTIDPAELIDLVFDELTVASECVRYRNMMMDTAGYVAPTSTPNYSYGWLPAVL